MGAQASLDMRPLKAMDAARSNENERRNWNEEKYDQKVDWNGNPAYYDKYRRHLNFEIVKGKILPQCSQTIPLYQRIDNRLKELGFNAYKNGASNAPNICMDFVIGGNRQRMRELAFGNQVVNFEEKDPQNRSVVRGKDIEQWALDTYKWAAKKYGEDNIVGFNVHLDETTPHIHMQVIPVAEKKKRGRVKNGGDRGTKLTVSYAGVTGESKEDVRRYLEGLHTDYHHQVGYKYGLERGTFADDLTPEERDARKHLTKKQYIAKKEQEAKIEQNNQILTEQDATIQQNNQTINSQKQQLYTINAEVAKANKKLKALTSMISNLEQQKEAIEIDITALEDEYAEKGNMSQEEYEKKLAEYQEKLDEIEAKIEDKNNKVNETTEQILELGKKKHQLQNSYDELQRKINKDLPTLQDRVVRDMQAVAWEATATEAKAQYKEINDFQKMLSPEQLKTFNNIFEESLFEELAERGNEIAAVGAALFLGYVDQATTFAQNSGGGGGGSTSGWGKKDDENDEMFRRRCFAQARAMMRPIKSEKKRGLHR